MGTRPRRRRVAPKRRIRRWLRRQDRFTRLLLVAVVALSFVVMALIVPRLDEKRSAPKIARVIPQKESIPKAPEKLVQVVKIPAARTTAKARSAKPPLPLPLLKPQSVAPRTALTRDDHAEGVPLVPVSVAPRVAIVIDDLGQSLAHLEQLADLDIPLTIAIIPGLPATARTVSEASRHGIEMLLHQPMEPLEEGGKNPGAGVLLTSMTPEAIRAQVRASLAAVPGAVGVNNHMGSRFTADTAGMGALIAEIKEHGLFWLDSRTTAQTHGVEVAHAAGVPALARDIFIDAEVNADAIRRQVRKLIEMARMHGSAVGIGHPHPETIAVLRELRAELRASGVTLVPITALVPSGPRTQTTLAAALPGKSIAGETAGNRKTAMP